MADIFADALSAIYSSDIGVSAEIEGATKSVLVIDKTGGIEAEPSAGAVHVPTLVPAACVRRAELAGAGLTVLSALAGKTITFNGKTWRIFNQRPRPQPTGEDSGELYLYLRRV